MIVTPFGEFSLEDKIALERWLDAHARRHRVITSIANVAGGHLLRSKVDGDWIYRHASAHVTIATALGALHLETTSADTKVLATLGMWKTERELQDWHDLHNRIHLKLDQVYKISG